MKLTENKIHEIEKFLDKKDLKQLDLRSEVLDHMANGIESTMEYEKITFVDAFNLEVVKWTKELAPYSNWWLGKAWTGPKIMIQKCVKSIKHYSFQILSLSIISATFIYLVFSIFDLSMYYSIINTTFGIIYLFISCTLILLGLKIKKTGYKTSYGFLFNIQASTAGYVYALCNPLLFESFGVFKNRELDLFLLVMHAMYTCYPLLFLGLYKAHMKAQNIKLA
tara:strand:+ start:7578 stop:8246 length:669 start_codon:yes stop_codon:yes gene_type:complete